MKQPIGQIALVVREYDEAINFYVGMVRRLTRGMAPSPILATGHGVPSLRVRATEGR